MTWNTIGETGYGEPIMRNEYGCEWEGGVGIAPDGKCCGECYGKDGCPVLKDAHFQIIQNTEE